MNGQGDKGTRGQGEGRGRPRAWLLLVPLSPCLLVCFVAGCRQEMANEPRVNPLAPSDFFPDGRSARDPEPGTVPRNAAPDRVVAAGAAPSAAPANAEEGNAPDARWVAGLFGLGAAGPFGTNALVTAETSAYVFPVPVDLELLKRGKERFNIYCSVCHDRVGTGRGKIVERGYLRPPSYHIDRLRQAPLTHFYDVISNGFGAMPSYSDKLSPEARWSIIAYIRALQLSQNATAEDLKETP